MAIFSDSRLPPPEGETLRAGDIAIHLLDGEPPSRFAAAELARYLPRLLPGADLAVYVGSPDRASAAAGFPPPELPAEEAIALQGNGHRYSVSGGSSAAILHAAYTLLESLGARWVKPGPEGAVVRPLDAHPPALSLVSAPAFPRRGLADGCLSWWPGAAPFQDWLGEAQALVDWMGKMRMNRFFVHFNRLPPGDLAPLLPELEKRGIALELGGHNLPKLLPPGLREAEPEICRLSGGMRRPDGNFCVSNPHTLRLLMDGARDYAGQLPRADLYHLWPYDAKEDPWCHCPSCSALTSGEQMWRAVTAAAEGVAAVHPGTGICGLLYHESLPEPDGVPAGTRTLFAPRERCYLHPIDGPCARNRDYALKLEAAMEQQGERLSVLEYYGDPLLFGRPANRPNLVASDLAAYQACGVQGISTLVFGTLSWWLYPVQLYAYARATWDPSLTGTAAVDYCEATAGQAAAESLLRYYRLEGEAAAAHLRFCGYGLDGSWATLPFPPLTPIDEASEHLTAMRRAEALLRGAGGVLAGLARGSPSMGVEAPARSVSGGDLAGAHDRAPLRDPLASRVMAAHRLEEAFHRAVIGHLARAAGEDGVPSTAFAEATAAMAEASPETRGVFGSYWMLPWLRRCVELGHEAPP